MESPKRSALRFERIETGREFSRSDRLIRFRCGKLIRTKVESLKNESALQFAKAYADLFRHKPIGVNLFPEKRDYPIILFQDSD